MKRLLLVLFSFIWLFFNSLGQNSSVSSGFDLRFIDENTGYAVFPEQVEIKNREDATLSHIISKEQIDQNGMISIPLANGVYDIVVHAQNYSSMTANFLLENKILEVCFNLDPLTPRKEMTSSYIQSLHQSDAMIIAGFIVDDLTGKPLENVMVFSSDEIARTYSEKNGFFQFAVPLPGSENEAEKRGTVLFIKDGYITEIKQDFDMWPEGDIIFRIRMKAGSGMNRESIIQHREINRVVME